MFSDGKFYRIGVLSKDKGRASVTGKEEDRYRFRTPTLRNVSLTGPYMHNGSFKTLDGVVTFYYRGIPTRDSDGLPLDVEALSGQSFSDIPLIVGVLKSLTGKLPVVEPPKIPRVDRDQPVALPLKPQAGGVLQAKAHHADQLSHHAPRDEPSSFDYELPIQPPSEPAFPGDRQGR
jgi:hypothetical protein